MLSNFGLKAFLSPVQLSRLDLAHQALHTSARKNIQVTSVLCAEPLKKKKKLDPAILKLQVDRRKRRLEKQLKKAQRFGRKLKPVEELELHREVVKDAPPRKLSGDIEVKEEQNKINEVWKEWKNYRFVQHNNIHQSFSMMLQAQEKALSELKIANPQLYTMAVQVDEDLLPYTFNGPVETPPKQDYIQDGKYVETTKSYELNPEIVKLMLEKNARKTKNAMKKPE